MNMALLPKIDFNVRADWSRLEDDEVIAHMHGAAEDLDNVGFEVLASLIKAYANALESASPMTDFDKREAARTVGIIDQVIGEIGSLASIIDTGMKMRIVPSPQPQELVDCFNALGDKVELAAVNNNSNVLVRVVGSIRQCTQMSVVSKLSSVEKLVLYYASKSPEEVGIC